MRHYLVTAAALLLTGADVRAEPISGVTYHSYAPSKHYKVTITTQALEKSPAWKGDAENPPLSASKAIKLATDLREKLEQDTKEYKWRLGSASLRPAGEGR